MWKSTDCNIVHDENQGCGTRFTEPYNFGREFNVNGGGVSLLFLLLLLLLLSDPIVK